MPTKPTSLKMFFCRITQPLDENLMESIPMYIKTKFYTHLFDGFWYVHETGLKTEKPHYHTLILCKTTKVEIQKWIKVNFKVKGNEEFSVTDKYIPDSKDLSLAYMLKGGLNELYESSTYKPGMVLCPHDGEESFYVTSEKYSQLLELYKKIRGSLKEIESNTKFDYYMDLVKETMCGNYGDINVIMKDLCYTQVLKKIYSILIRDAIKSRKRIMRCYLWDWSFTLTLHLCNYKEQDRLINQTIESEIDKKLTIII